MSDEPEPPDVAMGGEQSPQTGCEEYVDLRRQLNDAIEASSIAESARLEAVRQLVDAAELHLADEATIYQLQQGTAVRVLTERLAEAQAERDKLESGLKVRLEANEFISLVQVLGGTRVRQIAKLVTNAEAAEAELTTLRALVGEVVAREHVYRDGSVSVDGMPAFWAAWLACAREALEASSVQPQSQQS